MYLDTLVPIKAEVGYGQLGLHGKLGYEGKGVLVRQQRYLHALSAHPPARLIFHLGGRYASFRCQVALNDDVPAGISAATFTVLADGREIAAVPHMVAGQAPQTLQATIAGVQRLELVVRTSRWEHCHAVWLDPQIEEAPADVRPAAFFDCLGRAEVIPPASLPKVERCIATVVSPGFEALLDDMLGSLLANGGCQDTLLVIFALEANARCEQLAAKYQATLMCCRSRSSINATSKAVLYSVARLVDAQYFLCLDADLLVLGDVNPLFSALEACPEGSILVCREGNGSGMLNLEHALCTIYGGVKTDLERLLGTPEDEASYPLIVNDGVFAGGRTALLALDGVIRAMEHAPAWTDQRRDIWWRNQFIFNLALARMRCGVELDAAYNLQLHVQDVEFARREGRIQACWHGRPVRILHFSGVGRHKYPEWRKLCAALPDPLTGRGDGDGYAIFLQALRIWVGRHGLASLAWSFYGTTDARTASVRDPGTFPLFALLHYLIRANGCVRVLECGTARGVSTACIASALVQRCQGKVVSFDPYVHAERHELWETLPEGMRTCIEPRLSGSLEGMARALENSETYDAAFLDSLHTEEHVWAEFQLAAQLVCPGGLLLIHDVRYAYGTVERALRRIEEAGYGVVRLWTAESGVDEDDQLGLAVIENRKRVQTLYTDTHVQRVYTDVG